MNDDLPPTPLGRSLDMPLREWIEYYQASVVTKQLHYRGVPTWKNVFDLWVIQEIIHETQPEIVIEIGCKFGGTTLWLSDMMKTVAPGSVISVDLKRPRIDFPENVQFIDGDSIASGTVAQVQDICRGRRTMLLADGNHAAEHVFQELVLYGPMVAPGCYFIVEDGIVDVMDWPQYQPGPLVAVQRFLGENSSFVTDERREKFILTYAPGGFLKRVGG
jgi:cephalosporin hydroxylase